MNPAMTGSDGIPQPADTAEAEQMGAFVEDALRLEEAEQSGLGVNQDGEAIV
jgi:hypothetical protein